MWPKDKNHIDLNLVLVEFVAEDPEEIADLAICSETAQDQPCIDSETLEFFIDPDLVIPMYQMTLQMLGMSFKYPEDDLNNSVSADLQKSAE